MRNIQYFSILSILCLFFFSGCADGSFQESDLIPEEIFPPKLTVKNSSAYKVNKLYMHNTPEYITLTPVLTDFAVNSILEIPVKKDDEIYVTFVRNLTTTSTIEFASTTARPLIIQNSIEYTLNILETDFYLEKKIITPEGPNYVDPEK